jgi:hypothetical protein
MSGSLFSQTILVALLAIPVSSHSEPIGFLLAPTERVSGQSQAEWSKQWWEWAGSFTQSQSPIADTTGDKCHLKQHGPVWFLAGTYGTRRTVRTCKVPAGRYLFFPLINYVYVVADRSAPPTCAVVTANAMRATDNPDMLILTVDGVEAKQLTQHRQASPSCFNLGARAEPPFTAFPAAANGYYVMLRPLPRGEHELNFGGVLPNMQQAVTYRLIVE